MRYFFHFLSGNDRLDDNLGMEHVNVAQARAEAVRAAREMIAESLRQNRPVADDSVIEITDACGRLVDQISLIAAAFGETADGRYRRIFNAAPQGAVVLTADFLIVDVNAAFLRARQTERAAVTGRTLFDIYPGNPGGDGGRALTASLLAVLRDKVTHVVPAQRQDVRRGDGGVEERYWTLRNIPLLGADGAVEFIVHQAEDVTSAVLAPARGEVSRRAPSDRPPAGQAER